MGGISIITVTFNASSTVLDCLRSINNQSINVEHIVIDGESTDDTVDIVSGFSGHDIITLSEPDNGVYDAMNKGIRRSTGDIIGILNADDFYADGDVLKKIKSVFSDPTIDACYGDLKYIDPLNSGKCVRYWRSGVFDFNKFYTGWMPPHPTFFVRKNVYNKFGLFNLGLGSAADYEIMLRFLLKNKIKTVYIPEVLVYMRTGGMSNSSVMNRFKAHSNDKKAWVVNSLTPYPWTLPMKPLRKLTQWILK